jgi:hypothetical protein
MNFNHLQSKIGRAILALSLLFGIGMATSVTTQAQYQNDQWRQQRRYEREQIRRQREYQREQARRQRQSAGYGNYGYGNNGYGNYGNNGYGVSNQIVQTALNAGYNEGIKAGRNDRNSGRGYDYADSSAYRNASKDYNSRYGDPEYYRQYFRQGFVNGYTDGYRGY